MPSDAHRTAPRGLPDENAKIWHDSIRVHNAVPRPFTLGKMPPYGIRFIFRFHPDIPVGSVIAMRIANFAKQKWNVSGPGIV